MHWEGGGGAVRPFLLWFFAIYFKKLKPYLKILDFSQLFVVDAPTFNKNSFTPFQNTFVDKIAHAFEG